MVKAFIKSINELPDPLENREMLKYFPEFRKKKVRRYKQELDRKRSYGAWLLLIECLESFGLDPNYLHVTEKGQIIHDKVFLSLSHSGDYCFCCLSNKPIGCDVEETVHNYLSIAYNFFSEKEQEFIQLGKDEKEKEKRFLSLWTIKESFLKIDGNGIGDRLKEVSIDPTDLSISYKRNKQDLKLKTFEFNNHIFSFCYKA